MSFYTGQDGKLTFKGTKVARVQSWSITRTTRLDDDSKVGDCEKSYTPGPAESTGTAVIWYYKDDSGQEKLLKCLFNTGEAMDAARFKLGWGDKSVEFDGIVTSSTITCQAGAVMQANIQFTVSGKLIGVTL